MLLSDEQLQEALDAYELCGSYRNAAKHLGMPNTTFQDRFVKAKERLIYKVPEGQTLKGMSTLYDADGNKRLEWVKTDKDLDKQRDILMAVVEAMKGDIPRAAPVDVPRHVTDDLLSTYIITDYHVGCLAWGDETGENWDIDIAENMLVQWFAAAIGSAPASHTAILAQLGDFLHTDSLEAVTPTSGHILDADTRYQKMVEVVIRAIRRIIAMLLEKHQHVHIKMAEGNHDISSSVWLRALFAALYEDEPRVSVDNTHSPFYAYEWGKTSLFFHHGHKMKIQTVSAAFAGIYRDIFGRTKYSYCHMGHLHHRDVKENQMMIVEQHPTLAARDAYSARGGYLSQRGASVITYSKKSGEVARATIRPEMIGG